MKSIHGLAILAIERLEVEMNMWRCASNPISAPRTQKFQKRRLNTTKYTPLVPLQLNGSIVMANNHRRESQIAFIATCSVSRSDVFLEPEIYSFHDSGLSSLAISSASSMQWVPISIYNSHSDVSIHDSFLQALQGIFAINAMSLQARACMFLPKAMLCVQ